MKLNYSFGEIAQIIAHKSDDDQEVIQSISFDTRRIIAGENTLFFALNGSFRNGHSYIQKAYEKGVRHFVVSEKGITSDFENAKEIVVKDVLSSLEELAKHHRAQFDCTVIAITGSHGKTTVKEWLAILLNGSKKIARSPKSYNSRLGVAISLLEINKNTEVALIEAGIGEAGILSSKREMIQPTVGILTSFGNAHRELFVSEEEHLKEKLSLFEGIHFIYPAEKFKAVIENENSEKTPILTDFLTEFSLKNDPISAQNVSLAIRMAQLLGISDEMIQERIPLISPLSQRMEIFDGKNGNSIINDTYNLDIDSLEYSLSYQLANSGDKKRVILMGVEKEKEKYFSPILDQYQSIEVRFIDDAPSFNEIFSNTNILITGNRKVKMDEVAHRLKQLNHQTYLEFDLKSIRHNIHYFKSKLKADTKLLCMIKASSYGTDAKNIGVFLEKIGVDYLGVAYTNEGIELRKKGIKTPILVMNVEEQSFNDCIKYQLEPAIYSMIQLDAFVKELIRNYQFNYAIHIKIETGMNRLGFIASELPALIAFLKTQPEVRIKSIYSHLAESNVIGSDFTQQQITHFETISETIKSSFSYPILCHILNSEGIKNYPTAQMDMVRLGIGMYGVNGDKELRPAISWFSSVSQIKRINEGESVGYNRSFVAKKEMKIAVIPVGYADGLNRQLGEEGFGVYIQNIFCPVVGNICMDMITVDVTPLKIKEGEKVEIIGDNQSVLDLALTNGTISYEIMTRFSSRLHRKYID